jgi:hypothetical protein
MNGNAMYEVARQRVAEQRRAAVQAGEARERRATARAARRARKNAQETVAAPAIPDYAHEMFGAGGDAVPAPRQESTRDRDARSGR